MPEISLSMFDALIKLYESAVVMVEHELAEHGYEGDRLVSHGNFMELKRAVEALQDMERVPKNG